MWAGPLCTELLARGGASVIKIEPSSRPDGLRYGDGDDGSGNAPMFVELTGPKNSPTLTFVTVPREANFINLSAPLT